MSHICFSAPLAEIPVIPRLSGHKMTPPNPQVSSTCSNWVGSFIMVGVTGFEPAASWSRTKRSTKLSHTPFFHALELYHICGILSIFFLQLLSFFCLPNYGDGRCRLAARRSRRVRFSHTDKGQMFFIFPIGRQARSLFHAMISLEHLGSIC